MKKSLLILGFILLCVLAESQDFIYFKDKSVIPAKVLEVKVDRILYKRFEMPKGPTYEVLKSDIIKVKYSTGIVDVYTKLEITDSLKKAIDKKKIDTTNFATIYILFNDKHDESQLMPLYFNGHYVITFRNHMRLKYKMYSEGQLVIQRRGRNAYKMGPTSIF